MKCVAAYGIVIATGLVLLFGLDAWCAQLTADPVIRAFVLSDRFWRLVFAILFAFGAIAAFSCAALVFHPGRLSGRMPERGE